jgi:predicted TIM-barrel fold metal-dependent hydrolase
MPGAIDVHCHVFNIADLPSKGFVVDVFLRAELEGHPFLKDLASYATEFVSDVLTSYTPDVQAEQDFLSGKLDPADDPLSRGNTRAIHLLAASMPGSALSGSLPEAMRTNPQRAAFSERLAQNLRPDAASYLTGMTPETVVTVNPADLLESSPFGATVSQYLFWAVQMTDFRTRNIDRLFQMFGPERLGVSVIMPSMVDFHRWLGARPALDPGDPPAVNVDAQADLMTSIMKTRGDVLTFFPLDPLRDIKETTAAIEKHFSPDSATGFVGVKMYPPMGFRASTNDHIATFYKDSDPATQQMAMMAGQTVDNNLAELFRLCAKYDVPVMCHSNESNQTALSIAGTTPRPTYWKPVIQTYASLRLNLGHFGSVVGFANNPFDDNHTDIGEMFDGFDGQGSRVYADISCETSVDDPVFRMNFASAVQSFTSTKATQARRQRLLYGSDWDMLGVSVNFETYLQNWLLTADETAHLLGDSTFQEKFFRTNALDYLGLSDKTSANRARIVHFFGGENNAPDWLQSAVTR